MNRSVNMVNYNPNEIMKMIRQWEELNQTEFASKIGKSKRSVQGYEQGEFMYSVATLMKIAKEFGYDIVLEKKNNK